MAQPGRDITQELDVRDSIPPRTDEAFALYVIQGGQAGAVFALAGERMTVGREADLCLGDQGVSRVHARFERGSASVSIVDLGSTNGTFVNGERIDEPCGLLDGDQIALGRAVMRFQVQTSAEIRLAQQIYEGSIRDHLTGLYNRRYAEEQLHRATREVGSGFRSVCMLHVDGLAEINEDAGRGTGDELLRAVGTKLNDVFGSDDSIARWDGAELLVLSHEPEPEALDARLRALVSTVTVQGPRGTVNASASGGATHILPGANPAHILALAEQALQEARRRGSVRPGRPGAGGVSSRYSVQAQGKEIVRPR